ncbi:MAG: rane protein [Devosia sp.]|nr:rane protein [Devosia sp.]
MTRYLILYAACAVVFFPLDFLWLSTVGRTFYKREIGGLLLENPNLLIAALFYLAYLVGVVVLVAAPADGDIAKALLTGALLGLVAYGTYDLTNLSTLKGYTPAIAMVDLAWGTVLTAVSAAIGVWIAGFFS